MNQNDNHQSNLAAVYGSHASAESAVKLLNSNGFDMKKLSIIGQDYETEERPIGFLNAGDRMLSWGRFGAFWGSIWGLLFGSAMLLIPGVGTLMFAGYIVAALEGAAIGGGLAALAGAMASIGVPNDSVIEYVADLRAGSFLLFVQGDESDMAKAKDLLGTTFPMRLQRHSPLEPASV